MPRKKYYKKQDTKKLRVSEISSLSSVTSRDYNRIKEIENERILWVKTNPQFSKKKNDHDEFSDSDKDSFAS